MVDIEKLCSEARSHGFHSVCVYGCHVGTAAKLLQGTDVKVAAVCGFPHGAQTTSTKVADAINSVQNGATEIDMVLNIGALMDGNLDEVQRDIAQVVEAVSGRAIVKVIFETCLLSDAQIVDACRCSCAAGAAFVKTSTGFSSGGATEAHVRLMRETVGEACGVKASGGVRDLDAVMKMVAAGATRIGTSSGVQIVSSSPLSSQDASTY